MILPLIGSNRFAAECANIIVKLIKPLRTVGKLGKAIYSVRMCRNGHHTFEHYNGHNVYLLAPLVGNDRATPERPKEAINAAT